MVFGFVGVNGGEFAEVIKVHFDEILEFVAVDLKEGVGGVDELVEGVDYFLLFVVAHNDDF